MASWSTDCGRHCSSYSGNEHCRVSNRASKVPSCLPALFRCKGAAIVNNHPMSRTWVRACFLGANSEGSCFLIPAHSLKQVQRKSRNFYCNTSWNVFNRNLDSAVLRSRKLYGERCVVGQKQREQNCVVQLLLPTLSWADGVVASAQPNTKNHMSQTTSKILDQYSPRKLEQIQDTERIGIQGD